MIFDKLEIILVTFNRRQFLESTLASVLAPNSPARQLDITIFDNHSTDGTDEVVKRYQLESPKLKYVRRPRNIGGNANISMALASATKEYLWVLCDDDEYDWSGWSELEAAIERGEKLICAADFNLTKDARNSAEYLLNQMAFLPSIIFKTELLTPECLRNAFDYSGFLFPHLAPVVMHLNAGGKICVLDKPLVHYGRHITDVSFSRGTNNSVVFPRGRTMTIPVGYANICYALKDRAFGKKCYAVLVNGKQNGCQGLGVFLRDIFMHLAGRTNNMQVSDIKRMLPWRLRLLVTMVHALSCTPIYALFNGSRLYWWLRGLVDARNRSIEARKLSSEK